MHLLLLLLTTAAAETYGPPTTCGELLCYADGLTSHLAGELITSSCFNLFGYIGDESYLMLDIDDDGDVDARDWSAAQLSAGTCDCSARLVQPFDVDGDCVVTEDDVDCLMAVVNTRTDLPACLAMDEDGLDFNGDGTVDVLDAWMVYLETPFAGLDFTVGSGTR